MTATDTRRTPDSGEATRRRARRIGPREVVRHSLLVAWRNLKQIPRNPQLLVFIAIQPITLTVLFAFVFGGAIAPEGVDYIDYLVPGIVVQTVAFGTTTTAVGLAQDLKTGIIDRFRSLPIARSAVLTGRVLADLARVALTVTIVVVVGLLLGFSFTQGVVDTLLFFVIALAFGFAMSWIAALIGLAVSTPEVAQSAGFVWLFPLTFASSAFVPLETMPGWLQPFAEVNPITFVVDSLRTLALGAEAARTVGEQPILWSLAWIVGIVAVAAPLAVRVYRKQQ